MNAGVAIGEGVEVGQPITAIGWIEANDIRGMLSHLGVRARGRKGLLFAVHCCRRVWGRFHDRRSRDAVECAERFADGAASRSEYESPEYLLARSKAWGADPGRRFCWGDADLADAVAASCRDVAGDESSLAFFAVAPEVNPERLWQGELLHEMYGNPFRPDILNPAWLTSTVAALAAHMYEARDFSPMPILADALQDAGCENHNILGHCRRPGPHVRGCWVVDLALRKE